MITIKKEIDELVSKLEEEYKSLDLIIQVYYLSDIENQIKLVQGGRLSVPNGKINIVIALIGFIIKEKRKLINLSNVNKAEFFKEEIGRFDLTGKFFSSCWYENPENSVELLYALFNYITHEIPREYKESCHISIPNFLKLDSCYKENILPSFITRVYNDITEKDKLTNYSKIFE